MGIARRVLRQWRAPLFCLTMVGLAACQPVPGPLPVPVPTTTAPTTTTTTAAPLSVGTGSSDPAAFVDAYNRKGGEYAVGNPTNAVHSWGWGCNQDLSGGVYQRSALMQRNCSGPAYPVVGAQWAYIESHFGSSAPTVIGYPYNDPHRWGNGWAQDFDGGSLGWTILVRGDSVGAVYKVHTGFRGAWINYQGVYGYLGFPTSDEYGWGTGSKQDFQGGSLIWDAVNGVRQYNGQPPPTNTREQKAADWALAELNSPDPSWSDEFNRAWSGYCEGFAEVAYGTRSKFASSNDHYSWQAANGRIHTDASPPRGAVVFYSGHIGISMGDGTTISTQGYDGQRLKVWRHATTGFLYNAYWGWSYAPDSWPGR